MRLFAASTILGLAMLGGGCATAQSVASPPQMACFGFVTTGADADEIRRLEARGAAVNVQGWTVDEARAFFAPEWVSIGPNGAATHLPDVLAQFPDGRSRPWAARFELRDLDVRIYCDVAIVIGRAEAWAPGAAGDAPPGVRFGYLNVWRRTGEGWLYAAQHFTRN